MDLKEALYKRKYDALTDQQKKAVDIIYGPVMVIAGPGTGKTEVLSMRIANLLRSDAQVKPFEILCLTFTDEATINMRKRLIEIIGEDAHRVHIYTFHAFCNNIIQSNPEYFGLRDLMPISDLERMEVLHDILEQLPEGHALRRLKGNLFYDAKNLRILFDLMKSEDWSAEHVSDAIDFTIQDFPNHEKYIYKRGNAKKNIKTGDLKVDQIKKATDKLERTRAAALLYPSYQEKMQQMGRYDFNDMILWVIKAFKDKPEFLQIQQERFQYFLVDEFQDTSGAQSELLNFLTDYWEEPNLFIVGDDDQSIFEFQGARLQNIVDFYEKHKSAIQLIVLKENFRSTQLILDKAAATIKNNKQRLVYQLKDLNLDKNIIAANERFNTERAIAPTIRAYYNQLHEEAHIVQQIEALQKENVSLNNVAVLYAQHKQANNIISLLEKKKIPYWVKRPVNILQIPFIIQLINIFKYLQQESTHSFSGEDVLFGLMHAPFTKIKPLDIATLSLYLQTKERKHKYWRYLLQDSLLLETMDLYNATPFHQLGINLEKWLTDMKTLTIPMLLEKIIYDSGFVGHLLNGNNRIWDMQVLHSFFDFVKEETSKQPRMTVPDFLNMIEKMELENIEVQIQKIIKQENGVRFYTTYSAKGHEFEHVFLIGLTKNYWESKSGNNKGFGLPDTLTKTLETENEDNNSEEVARRLFYVALTRAKKYLQVSFAKKDNKEKDLEPSCFIDEISTNDERIETSIEDEDVLLHLTNSFLPDPEVNIELAKKELIEKRLEQFVLSVSAMNKYLDCPLSFYYEYILRVPAAKSDALAFGTAVHYALEQLFKKMNANEDHLFPTKEEVLSSFNYAMRREESAFTALQYTRRLELGEKIISEYFDHYINSFNKIVVTEYNIGNTTVNGVPIKGKLDKIEFDGTDCIVVDYKTGNPDYSSKKELLGPSEKNPNGGDYWRQMVFYKLLLENFPAARHWKMISGVFDFIEKNSKDEFVRFTVPINENDLTTVKEQIKEVYQKIMNHEFSEGCGKEDCQWCNFARTYELAKIAKTDVSDY